MSARDIPPELMAQTWAQLPREQRAAIRAAVARGLEALKAPEPLTLFQWAEKKFYLSSESSQGEQKWRAYPPQRGILCMMGDDWIEELDVMKSARVGYTKMALAFMAMQAEHKRRNGCVWQPTDADSDEFCKAEVEPMLRDVKAMAKVFPEFMRKSKANTLNMKKFLGSLLYLKGGTSAGNYRRMTLQWFIGDEFSAFDDKIEGSADPWTLMWKRLEGATHKKGIVGSTPRVQNADHTERRFNAAVARMRYHITCPHCDAEHPLSRGALDPLNGSKATHGMHWDMADPENTVHHICPHCHGAITQVDYFDLWDHGVWVSDCGNYRCYALASGEYYWTDDRGCRLTVPPRHVGVHIWTAYSKMVGWGEIVREYLEALAAWKTGERGPMEGFINETLGLTTKDEVEETDAGALRRRAEAYPLRRVPRGGVELVCGVDTQDAWWALTVLAVGRDNEAWVVDYQEISGDPGNPKDWDNILLPYLTRTLHHWDGAPMTIARTGIDHGGSHSHQVAAFCKRHEAKKIHAIKGESQDGKPIKSRLTWLTTNQRGKKVRTGEKLWFVGTGTAKDEIFSRLQFKQHGAGYIHFSTELEQRYYDGLTSEVRRKKHTAKGIVSRWEPKSAGLRNEPLDTLVYALWACEMQGYSGFSERQWQLKESALEPDLFLASDTLAPTHTGPASTLPVIEVETDAVDDEDSTDPAAPNPAQRLLDLPAPPRAEPKPKTAALPPAPPTPNPFAPADWLSRGFS
jgi:phage terminase large subunit GpA-like protein